MVRSIGIDPGDQAVKVVEVEGSYKKTRLLRVHVATIAASAADGGARVDFIAETARTAIDAGMRGEVCLGHPCREAVLRVIELPFKGHDAIRKVIKAEIEGEIQSQSVDDMIVDFHEIGAGTAGGTRILVASVPKAGLRAQLGALSAHKIEAERVDLDTMALWRAAHWAGAFAVDAVEAAANDGKRVTAVIDLGALSVKVLLVEGEHLVEMRALRLGDGVVADDVARRHGLDVATAREAARRCLLTGTDQRLDVAAALAPALPPAVDGAAPEVAAALAPARAVVVKYTEVEAAHTAYLQRLARELTRFLTASGRQSQLRAVWVTGGASRAAGTNEMLAAVFGCEVKELDVLARLQHDLTPEEVTDYGSRLTTALGLALGRLGGPDGFQLRQEDLLLTRGFERVKFPLAIVCMVALIALFAHWNKKNSELRLLHLQIGSTFIDKAKPKAPPIFYGMLNSVFASSWFENSQQFRVEQTKGKDFVYKDLVAELDAAPVHKRLGIVRDRLKLVVNTKQKQSGIYEDISLESGLAVLVRWSDLLQSIEPELGRYLVPKVELSMKAPNRRVEFTIAFRGEDFRNRRALLQRAIEAEIQKADSPFELPEKSDERKDEELFRDAEKSGVAGAYFRVVLHVRDVFLPFGPSGSPVIGAASGKPPERRLEIGDGTTKTEVVTTEGRR